MVTEMTPTQLYKTPEQVDWATPIVVDFETYYGKEYSLSKVTTERYIRGEEFECIGVSVKVGGEPAQFYPRGTGISVIAELMKQHPTSPFVAHNVMFDMAILAWRYNLHPNFIVDTLPMAKLCGLDRVANGVSLAKLSAYLEKMGLVRQMKGTTVHDMKGVHANDMTPIQWVQYASYCVLDSELCYALYTYMIDKVPTTELIMVDITTRMMTRPAIELDVPLLQDYAVRLETERETILSTLAKLVGFTDTKTLLSHLRSSKQFVALLERMGIEVPMKFSEKQHVMIPAVSKTDIAFLDLLEHENPDVVALVETKLGTMSSMEQTRTATFLDVASRGLMPIPLRYAAAHTGRYGGVAWNVQNLPKRTKEPVLRRSMRAIKDHLIVASDSSQIECRLLSYIADQTDVVDVFVSGKDVYIDMATKIYGESYDAIYEQSKGTNATRDGKMKRNIAKAVVLGAGFGASAAKFAELMKQQGLADQADMAESLIATYRATNNKVTAFWFECNKVLDTLYAGGQMWFGGKDHNLFFADGSSTFHGVKIPSIRLPNGTYLFYQNLRREADKDGRTGYVYDQFKGRNWLPKRIWGSSLVENLTQALAFAVLKHQAIEIAKAGVPINLNVHDEWVSVVPKAHAAYVVATHYKAMKSVPHYIPQGLLDCEVDVGLNYADLKTVDVGKYV